MLGAPEPWQPVDSLLWGKTMGLWLSLQLAHRTVPPRAVRPRPAAEDRRAVAAVGRARAAGSRHRADAECPCRRRPAAAGDLLAVGDLLSICRAFPSRSPCLTPPPTNGRWMDATARPARRCSPAIRIWRSAFRVSGIWRGSRRRTSVLAGATAPGVPFLVLGHNGHIAWTFTTTGADVQDVFIETPAGDGHYQTPDGPRPFTVHEERIKIRGEPDQMLTVRETRHGPVISDLHPDGGPILAVAMANLAPGNTAAAGLLALNQAQDVEACRQGRGADHLAGAEPAGGRPPAHRAVCHRPRADPPRRRRRGAGAGRRLARLDRLGLRRSAAALRRPGERPAGERQRARRASPNFPVFLGRDWFGDWRARRIRELLDRSDRLAACRFRPHAARCAIARSPGRSCPCCWRFPPPRTTARTTVAWRC